MHTNHESSAAPDSRLLSRDECARLLTKIGALRQGGGVAVVTIRSAWNGELRFARNRVTLASDRKTVAITIDRTRDGKNARVVTNQTDDESLAAAMRFAEWKLGVMPGRDEQNFRTGAPDLPTPPAAWSDATASATGLMRTAIAQSVIAEAAAQGAFAAGFVAASIKAEASQSFLEANAAPDPSQSLSYWHSSRTECSMTVRAPAKGASGWAGVSGYDWSAIDGRALGARALRKCLDSANPVAVEPGRYTVVLEPQAVYGIVQPLVETMLDREREEKGQGIWTLAEDRALNLYRTKLGLKIVDERVTIHHDPSNPQLGIDPQAGLAPMTWIDRGVLTTFANPRETHALPKLNDNLASLKRHAFKMDGGPTTIEEMIANTERGLLVTRFSNVAKVDENSILLTGYSRDGLWLIERGKISKPVKNMRFVESPLFVLNNLDQLGAPAPVLSNDPAMVPPIKAHDFSFSSLSDAV